MASMEAKSDGGPAFPQIETDCESVGSVDSGMVWSNTYSTGGMSLRAWLTGQAFAAVPPVSREDIARGGTEMCAKATAQWAVRLADAAIAELERTKETP